jgi:galactitol-specific phosphotransferase system IIB component
MTIFAHLEKHNVFYITKESLSQMKLKDKTYGTLVAITNHYLEIEKNTKRYISSSGNIFNHRELDSKEQQSNCRKIIDLLFSRVDRVFIR